MKITFEKSTSGIILKMLEIPEPKCTFCGVNITEQNFGGIAQNIVCCRKFPCLIQFSDNIVEPN